jgi:heme exporter protein A
LTVRENLRFWAALRGGDTVEEALDAFGLARLADLPARLLSSGESRRLALARRAAAEAPLWLLDEPTVGLDQPSLERLVEQIRRHRVRGGMLAIAIHGPFVLDNARTLDMGTRGTQGTPS